MEEVSIEEMEQQRKQFEMEGQYLEANEMKERIQTTKIFRIKQQLDDLMEKQEQDR
eukprot:CAMPEP_0202956848 /NCGR_PEP_ID=MMETSP1396-20130829/1335_1 /ASSEMBLY_ACC=CAM_ASM_000872 /TAXON_ID= /ORGANISM="Pseudokeronopsis sp., Strain Brazil" /LENGTH=55 /DNA_ID=CAMNT_0049674051 /DNA_START=6 /DNA_END=173 /DNA_ORIENTATION=+